MGIPEVMGSRCSTKSSSRRRGSRLPASVCFAVLQVLTLSTSYLPLWLQEVFTRQNNVKRKKRMLFLCPHRMHRNFFQKLTVEFFFHLIGKNQVHTYS